MSDFRGSTMKTSTVFEILKFFCWKCSTELGGWKLQKNILKKLPIRIKQLTIFSAILQQFFRCNCSPGRPECKWKITKRKAFAQTNKITNMKSSSNVICYRPIFSLPRNWNTVMKSQKRSTLRDMTIGSKVLEFWAKISRKAFPGS